MHSAETRTQLEQCRRVLARADTSEEMRLLADDLLTRLLHMHDERTLHASVLLLALDSLELVAELEPCVAAIRTRIGGADKPTPPMPSSPGPAGTR
jgi:hypothetical protein